MKVPSVSELMYEMAAYKSSELPKGKKLIFIRNVHTIYKPGIHAGAILAPFIKHLDNDTDDSGIIATHSTMSCMLDDGFYGLTTDNVKREYIHNGKGNLITASCDLKQSTYAVYCCQVNDEEYKKIKISLQDSVQNQKIPYNIVQNVKIGLDLIKSKLTHESADVLTTISPLDFSHQHLVCSTYVSFILKNCVPSIASFIRDFNFVSPNRLTKYPFMRRMFEGKWIDYEKDCCKYVKQHPELKRYCAELKL